MTHYSLAAGSTWLLLLSARSTLDFHLVLSPAAPLSLTVLLTILLDFLATDLHPEGKDGAAFEAKAGNQVRKSFTGTEPVKATVR